MQCRWRWRLLSSVNRERRRSIVRHRRYALLQMGEVSLDLAHLLPQPVAHLLLELLHLENVAPQVLVVVPHLQSPNQWRSFLRCRILYLRDGLQEPQHRVVGVFVGFGYVPLYRVYLPSHHIQSLVRFLHLIVENNSIVHVRGKHFECKMTKIDRFLEVDNRGLHQIQDILFTRQTAHGSRTSNGPRLSFVFWP